MKSVKLPYGLLENVLWHISKIGRHNRGKRCGCVCPKCGVSLIARMGEERADHFAHVGGAVCEGAAEYALREKLKELLEKEGTLFLSQSTADVDGKSQELIGEMQVRVKEVKCVDGGDPFRPQLEIQVKADDGENETIIAEISLGQKKTRGYEEFPNTFAEIDLSQLGEDYSEDKLVKVALGGIRCFNWIRREKADNAEEKIREELRIEKIRTTEAEKQRLLSQAKIKNEQEKRERKHSGVPEFDVSKPEVVIEEKPGAKYSMKGFYICYTCSTEGLTADDMVQFNTKTRKGYCKKCRYAGR